MELYRRWYDAGMENIRKRPDYYLKKSLHPQINWGEGIKKRYLQIIPHPSQPSFPHLHFLLLHPEFPQPAYCFPEKTKNKAPE